MKREDEWLREACAQLAQEETEQLEKSMNRKATQEAEALFQRHKRQALKLIAKNSKKRGSFPVTLRVAACLVLVVGAVWLALSQQSKEPTPLSPVYTASVAPFVSASLAPSPTITPSPMVTPVPTVPPASTPNPYFRKSDWEIREEDAVTSIPTLSPTSSPTITPEPTFTPKLVPTKTPIPTLEVNTEPEPDAYQTGLDVWNGNYFLGRFAAEWELIGVEQDAGCQRIEYRIDGISIAFTEYAASQMIETPADASLAYVALDDNGIALKMTLGDRVILAWEAGGQTLVLEGNEQLAEQLAASVEKISPR